MGKRIRVQRRGKGGSTFQASTQRRIAPAKYPPLTEQQRQNAVHAEIMEIYHEPGRGSPLAKIKLQTGHDFYFILPEGVHKGQKIQIGSKAPIDIGNILPLTNIPEGTMICGIEQSPGDGGKIARSSGTYATIVDHTPQGTMIKFPSGKTKYINRLCRATIGIVSAAGRPEKPLLKAGKKYHMKKAKGHKYPRTRGIAMVAAAHPYGSSKKGGRKVTTVARGAPPGKKVGLIAARGAGKKQKRRR
ncbi:MAG: 50S ribosomal protein L2 [Candidatus Bathyarchaeota archaeon]|nr:MAG: 50S ribosomal protein L2 [Candidatus Bathyarchaeota archaeon]